MECEKQELLDKVVDKDQKLGSALKKIQKLKVAPVKEEQAPMEIEPIIDQDHFHLAESRLEQIHHLMQDKERLQNQLDQVFKENIMLRQPYNDSIVKELKYQVSLQDHIKQDLVAKSKEVETLQMNRRAFQNQIMQEEEKKRKVIEQELKKCEQDVTRLRQDRDQLARNYNTLLAKEQQERTQLEEIVCLLDTRKDRIDALESELTRLKMQYCQNHDHFELSLLVHQENGEISPEMINQLQEKLGSLQNHQNIEVEKLVSKLEIQQKV